MLCACQVIPTTSSDCDKQYGDNFLEFVRDDCGWRVNKKGGPDFDLWEIDDLNGKRVADIYLGGAPDIAYKKGNVAPQLGKVGKYELAEVADENGYEALLTLPKDRYGRLMYVHIFSPALNLDDLNKVRNLVRSIRTKKE